MSIQTRAIHAVSQFLGLNVLMWLTMLTLFAAILFLAAAAYMALTTVLAPALAGLFSGLALLAVFLMLAIALGLMLRTPREPAQPPAEANDQPRQHQRKPVLGERAGELARNHTDIVVAGALVAGVAVAASPGLRRFVVRAAGPLITRRLIRAVDDFTDR